MPLYELERTLYLQVSAEDEEAAVNHGIYADDDEWEERNEIKVKEIDGSQATEK